MSRASWSFGFTFGSGGPPASWMSSNTTSFCLASSLISLSAQVFARTSAMERQRSRRTSFSLIVAGQQHDRLVDGGGQHVLFRDRQVLGFLAEYDAARHLDAVQR